MFHSARPTALSAATDVQGMSQLDRARQVGDSAAVTSA